MTPLIEQIPVLDENQTFELTSYEFEKIIDFYAKQNEFNLLITNLISKFIDQKKIRMIYHDNKGNQLTETQVLELIQKQVNEINNVSFIKEPDI